MPWSTYNPRRSKRRQNDPQEVEFTCQSSQSTAESGKDYLMEVLLIGGLNKKTRENR
jgi:hypothetical protein